MNCRLPRGCSAVCRTCPGDCRGPRLRLRCLSRAHLEPGRTARHPAPAYRRARRLPGVDLQQPPSVENLWARLKEWRAVATRYEKTAPSFLGILCLAATADWLK